MTNSRKLIKKFLGKYRVIFSSLLIIIIVGIMVESVVPYIYGEVIDNITQKNLADLKYNLILFFLISIGIQCLTILETYTGKIVSTKIENGLKEELYKVVMT